MRLMQHKKEAWWFYRYLSVFYDNYVNPLFWTEEMRDSALELCEFDSRDLSVIDVGSGTGFTTQGIVKHVDARNVKCVDQSPHQMSHAQKKPDLQECSFEIGDAEDIPAKTSSFDRYVSAGSIEYWPDPQQGINEAYRVIKPGGLALMIGPLEPGSWFSRTMANLWMLFPKDEEYRMWFRDAGFRDIKVKYVKPHWHRSKSNKYGIAISGRKPLNSEAETPPAYNRKEETSGGFVRQIKLIFRVIIGSVAGFVFIPIAFLGYLWSVITGKPGKGLTKQQILALIVLAIIIFLVIRFLI